MSHTPGARRATRHLLFILVALSAVTACGQDEPANEPSILSIGHGEFIGNDGHVLKPNRALFDRTQRDYLDSLTREAKANNLAVDATRTLIASQVDDPLLANALLIDWLIDAVQPPARATMTSVNAAIRTYYLDNLAPAGLADADRRANKGLGADVAQRLAAGGIETHVATQNGGARYIEECAAAGVPIPPTMFSSSWVSKGIITDEFIDTSKEASLYQYTSDKPPGVCLALPRYTAGSKNISVLGIICLGTLSNKACFWDSPNGSKFQLGTQIPLSKFVGGVDLATNGQGVCSDCHAGENPFVVHPEKTPFSGFSVFGNNWYDPIVSASWPQNPGPSNLLAGVASTGHCDSCHAAGLSGGRFPALSTELPSYCGVVLATAALDNAPNRTMPPFGADWNKYTNHMDVLRDACKAPPSTGTIVTGGQGDNPGFVSPPIVIDPLYACAGLVAVRGAVLDAKVTLFINGNPVGSLIARNPDQEVFSVPALVIGDKVTAQQKSGGALSAMSAEVIVRDHKLDYPAGLPAPVIDPTLIYECADLIAVRGVPGATITVYSNGGMPVSGGTSTDWTMFGPGKHPFVIGDQFTAEQSLCADTSPMSDKVNAVKAPNSMPAPSFDPPQVFTGQQLINVASLTNGSHTTMSVSGAPAGGFSTPISRWNNYDLKTALGHALGGGDSVSASQKLCMAGPENKTPPAGKCEELPPPRIFTPLAGTNFVVVWQAIPGARIRVYDASNTEIGDGSGSIITLSRNLTASDVLTVVQQVGECTSQRAYRISVKGGK